MSSFTPSTLPIEIFLQVLDDLCVWDKIRLSIVNKEWKAFFDYCSGLWEKLDFGLDFGHPETDFDELETFDITAIAQFYITKANYDIRQLHIQTEGGMTYDWHALSLEYCSKLVDLTLESIYNDIGSLLYVSRRLPSLKRLGISGGFGIDIPVEFLQNSLLLESARFTLDLITRKRCFSTGRISPTLRSLEFNYCSDVLNGAWLRFPTNIIDGAFSLEELTIRGHHEPIATDYTHLAKLQKLKIPSCRSVTEFLVPSSITELEVSLPILGAIPKSSPLIGLNNLTLIYYLEEDNDFELEAFAQDLETAFEKIGHKLEELHLEHDIYRSIDVDSGLDVTIVITLLLISKFSNIKYLTLDLPGWLKIKRVSSIHEAFPRLNEFFFQRSHCGRITKFIGVQ